MIGKNRLSLIMGTLAVALFFGSIGFTIGYYRYSPQISQEKLEREKAENILNALIKAQEDSLYSIDKGHETTVANQGDTVTKDTILVYKTLYTQCQSVIEENDKPTSELIGLNEKGVEEYINMNFTNSEIESFSKEEVVITRRENKVCPNHYLISVNKGYITVYKYNKDGEKELVEETEIPIKMLPTVDQEKLQRGILVETLEDVDQLLEDYSS